MSVRQFAFLGDQKVRAMAATEDDKAKLDQGRRQPAAYSQVKNVEG